MLPSAGRLLLRERDVLNLPVVISGVEDVDGSGYVLQAALGKEALGTQGRGQGGEAGGVDAGGGGGDVVHVTNVGEHVGHCAVAVEGWRVDEKTYLKTVQKGVRKWQGGCCGWRIGDGDGGEQQDG